MFRFGTDIMTKTEQVKKRAKQQPLTINLWRGTQSPPQRKRTWRLHRFIFVPHLIISILRKYGLARENINEGNLATTFDVWDEPASILNCFFTAHAAFAAPT